MTRTPEQQKEIELAIKLISRLKALIQQWRGPNAVVNGAPLITEADRCIASMCADQLEALIKTSDDPRGWQPIETAPKKKQNEEELLVKMFKCYQELKALGWNDAMYCPKDGSHFDAIEAGSTGIHDCNYEGEWPDGHWWIYDGDMWPARPILFRLKNLAPPVTGQE